MHPSYLFCGDIAVAEIESGGYQFKKKSALGIEWAIGLTKETVNGKEMLRVTIQGKDKNSSKNNSWTATIEANFTIYSTLLNAKNLPLQKINGETSSVMDVMDWNHLVNPSNNLVYDGRFVPNIILTIIECTIDSTNHEVHSRKRKIDHSTQSPLNDFALIVEGKTIYVGRQFLATFSSYFNTLFFGDFAEKEKEEVELKDVNYEDFMRLLDQLYPNKPPLDISDVEGLLKVADQFEVEDVLSRVEEFIFDSSSFSLAKKFLLSDRYRLSLLKDNCFSQLKDNEDIHKLADTSEYKEFSLELKVLILEKTLPKNK